MSTHAINGGQYLTTVEPPVSDHSQCQALLAGCLQKVVTYKSLDHTGSKS